jgi:hypothetical protein
MKEIGDLEFKIELVARAETLLHDLSCFESDLEPTVFDKPLTKREVEVFQAAAERAKEAIRSLEKCVTGLSSIAFQAVKFRFPKGFSGGDR